MSKLWISPTEIGELFRRAKHLVDHRGFTKVPRDRIGSYTTQFAAPTFIVGLADDDNLYVEDRVAFVMIADYDDGGIKEVYGSTAKNVLHDMRKLMVLEDIAGV